MNNKLYKSLKTILLTSFVLTVTVSCEKLVEDGYRIDYPESDAIIKVEPLGHEMGATGERVNYKITVQSDYPVKSLVVQANYPGESGTGYDVATEGFDDPFIDHNYGTVQKNTTSFVVKYDYIIPRGIRSAIIVFSVIDEQGKASVRVRVNVVPAIKKYPATSLYAKDGRNNDAFATIDGTVYPDIRTNYTAITEESLDVQERLDIFFYVAADVAYVCAPDDDRLRVDLQVENQTKFMKLSKVTEEDFNSVTSASLVDLTKNDSIPQKGSSRVSGIRVGDIIGFTTDVNAAHSLKTGLIRVTGLHPTNISRYEGTSYVMKCDIVTQTDL